MDKFTLTFKTPDVLDDLPQECFDCDEEGYRDLKPDVAKVLDTFLKYDEYIQVEFDPKLQTAKVRVVQ